MPDLLSGQGHLQLLQLCAEVASEGALWQDTGVAKKRKPRRFRAVEAVKALARERIGTPPASKVVPDRKKKTLEKHKTTLGKLLEEG